MVSGMTGRTDSKEVDEVNVKGQSPTLFRKSVKSQDDDNRAQQRSTKKKNVNTMFLDKNIVFDLKSLHFFRCEMELNRKLSSKFTICEHEFALHRTLSVCISVPRRFLELLGGQWALLGTVLSSEEVTTCGLH